MCSALLLRIAKQEVFDIAVFAFAVGVEDHDCGRLTLQRVQSFLRRLVRNDDQFQIQEGTQYGEIFDIGAVRNGKKRERLIAERSD